MGIGALAVQGSVAALTEGRDATFPVKQFFLPAENKATQNTRYFRQESIEVRPFVPKGFCSIPINRKLSIYLGTVFSCVIPDR